MDAINITEGGVESVCLQTVGTPAVDSVLTVAVVFGTAGPTGEIEYYTCALQCDMQISCVSIFRFQPDHDEPHHYSYPNRTMCGI